MKWLLWQVPCFLALVRADKDGSVRNSILGNSNFQITHSPSPMYAKCAKAKASKKKTLSPSCYRYRSRRPTSAGQDPSRNPSSPPSHLKDWSSQNLTASDGGLPAWFGYSVAVSDALIVIGAPVYGDHVGCVYVFGLEITTGKWVEQTKIMASDGVSGDLFGSSVAIDKSLLVVGAVSETYDGGSVYIFEWDGSNWNEKIRLTDSVKRASFFGHSVSVSGDTTVVGATRGSFIYQRDADGEWREKRYFYDGHRCFSGIVDISGDTVVIGTGQRAYIIKRNAPTGDWNETEAVRLIPFSSSVSQSISHRRGRGVCNSGPLFGSSAAISGTTIIVGGPSDSNENGERAGAVWLFESISGDWAETAKIVSSDGRALFGSDVSISQDTAVVTARQATLSSPFLGTILYVFKRNISTSKWTELTKLFMSDAVEVLRSSNFEDIVVVGAPKEGQSSGAVYVF